jgi:hypothetical protein
MTKKEGLYLKILSQGKILSSYCITFKETSCAMKRKNQQDFHSSYNKLVNLVNFILFYFIIVGKKTIARNGKLANGPNEQVANGECERYFFVCLISPPIT